MSKKRYSHYKKGKKYITKEHYDTGNKSLINFQIPTGYTSFKDNAIDKLNSDYFNQINIHPYFVDNETNIPYINEINKKLKNAYGVKSANQARAINSLMNFMLEDSKGFFEDDFLKDTKEWSKKIDSLGDDQIRKLLPKNNNIDPKKWNMNEVRNFMKNFASNYNGEQLPVAQTSVPASNMFPYKSYQNTLPENLQNHIGDGYRNRRYWKLNGRPNSFDEGIDRGMFTLEDDGWHAGSVAYNEKTGNYEFMKSRNHPTLQYELDWYNSNDAKEFRDNFGLDTRRKYYKYTRNKYPISNDSRLWTLMSNYGISDMNNATDEQILAALKERGFNTDGYTPVPFGSNKNFKSVDREKRFFESSWDRFVNSNKNKKYQPGGDINHFQGGGPKNKKKSNIVNLWHSVKGSRSNPYNIPTTVVYPNKSAFPDEYTRQTENEQRVSDWFNSYYQSEGFKKRLGKAFIFDSGDDKSEYFKDDIDTINYNLEWIKNNRPVYLDLGLNNNAYNVRSGYYDKDNKNIIKYGGVNAENSVLGNVTDTLAHETAHAYDPYIGKWRSHVFTKPLYDMHSSRTQPERYFKKDENENPLNFMYNESHEEDEVEEYADLMALRYKLYELGIKDSRTGEEFTKRDIKKLRRHLGDGYDNNSATERFLRTHKLKDVVKALNDVAYEQTDNNNENKYIDVVGINEYDYGNFDNHVRRFQGGGPTVDILDGFGRIWKDVSNGVSDIGKGFSMLGSDLYDWTIGPVADSYRRLNGDYGNYADWATLGMYAASLWPTPASPYLRTAANSIAIAQGLGAGANIIDNGSVSLEDGLNVAGGILGGASSAIDATAAKASSDMARNIGRKYSYHYATGNPYFPTWRDNGFHNIELFRPNNSIVTKINNPLLWDALQTKNMMKLKAVSPRVGSDVGNVINDGTQLFYDYKDKKLIGGDKRKITKH